VLNAANEVAVHAFLAGRLRFLEIPDVIAGALAELGSEPVRDFASLYEADHRAREVASAAVAALG
jgi:1-deoxy-D-xylulose-5-phosphate reductoisomerase